MMVAGIDPSLVATSVAISDGKIPPIVKTFSSERIDDTVRGRFLRYENMVASVADFLEAHSVQVCYIENYVFGSWDVTPMTEYGALLRWHLLEFGPVHEIANTTLKKFSVGRSGHKKNPVTKQHVIDAIEHRYGVKFERHDEYEAFAAMRLGLIAERVVNPRTIQEGEAAILVAGKATAKKTPRKRRSKTTPVPRKAPQKGL